jgi:hypothetical protein
MALQGAGDARAFGMRGDDPDSNIYYPPPCAQVLGVQQNLPCVTDMCAGGGIVVKSTVLWPPYGLIAARESPVAGRS